MVSPYSCPWSILFVQAFVSSPFWYADSILDDDSCTNPFGLILLKNVFPRLRSGTLILFVYTLAIYAFHLF